MMGRITGVAPEMQRFLATASAGLVIDIAIAWALIALAGFSDLPAAACGLFAGMVFNYFVHLRWTFRDHDRRASLGHFLRFATTVAITLAIRAGVLSGIAAMGWQSLLHPVVRLGISAIIAFFLSYGLCRYLVFGPEKDTDSGSKGDV